MTDAATFTGTPVRTIASWREVGLLPNTDRRDPHCFWYLRADLERVLRADRYRDGAVRRVQLLEQIRNAAV